MYDPRANRFRPHFDALEERSLMASGVSATLRDGLLTILGTDRSDRIVIRQADNQIVIQDTNFAYDASQLRSIVIEAGAGDDFVDLGGVGLQQDRAVSVPAAVSGGEGDDRLIGGQGQDLLRGGAGNDELLGGNGDDELRGGDGNDKLYGGWGQDYLDGGAGRDRMVGGGDLDWSHRRDPEDRKGFTWRGSQRGINGLGKREFSFLGERPLHPVIRDHLVGLSQDEAASYLKEHELTMRVVGRAITLDLKSDRVNVEVVDGKVTNVLGIF